MQADTSDVTLASDVTVTDFLADLSVAGGTRFRADAAQRLTVGAVELLGPRFTTVSLRVVDGPVGVIDLEQPQFLSMDPTQVQLEIARSSGTFTILSPSFATQPTTGAYVSVPNAAVTVTLDGATPGSCSTFCIGAGTINWVATDFAAAAPADLPPTPWLWGGRRSALFSSAMLD